MGESLVLQTLYIGGGTPTLIPIEDMLVLIRHIRRQFVLSADYEWTMEANPGTVCLEQLRQLRQAGINRLSFGLQAKQPHLLQMLGRIHSYHDLQESVRKARLAGISNLNVDILVGLPRQTQADVRETVEAVLDLPVSHVSYYSLILEEGTEMAASCAAGELELPDDELERAQYNLVRDMLAAAGFQQYEISNSARPGYACRHNLTYWQALPYLAFGTAAHRYTDGLRSSNTEDLDTYMNAWLDGQPQAGADNLVSDHDWRAAHRVSLVRERVDRDEAMREMMLLGLRLTAGVRYEDFWQRFARDLRIVFDRELVQLEDRGLICRGAESVYLSRAGLDLANQVFMAFVL